MKTVSIPSKIIRTHKDGTVDTYHVRRAIGKGGFATVYEVSRLKSDQKFAIKAIPLANLKENERIKRQLEEINIQTSLSHPNICRFYDYFKDNFNLYMVLELCPYNTVHKLLKDKGKFTEFDAADIIEQVLEGVKYLHQNSVIHRDIKLQNLLIGSDGKIKISDFGISIKLSSQLERCYSTCGTYGFMPPEMFIDDNDGYSFESDIWSIGVCTFMLLTGQSPFASKDKVRTERLIRNAQYRIPPHSHLSFAAKDFLRSILQSNPENRLSIDDLLHHPFIENSQKTPHTNFFENLLEEYNKNQKIAEQQQQQQNEQKDQPQEQLQKPEQQPPPNQFAQSYKPKKPKLYKPSPQKLDQKKQDQHFRPHVLSPESKKRNEQKLQQQPLDQLQPPNQFGKSGRHKPSKQRDQSPQKSEQLQDQQKEKDNQNINQENQIHINQQKEESQKPKEQQPNETQTPKKHRQKERKQSPKRQSKKEEKQNAIEEQQQKEEEQKITNEQKQQQNEDNKEPINNHQEEQNIFAQSYIQKPLDQTQQNQDPFAKSCKPNHSTKQKKSELQPTQDQIPPELQQIETIKQKKRHHSLKHKSPGRQKSPKNVSQTKEIVNVTEKSDENNAQSDNCNLIPSYSVIRFCNKSKRGDLYYFMKNGQVGMITHDRQRLVLDPFGEFIQMWPDIDTNNPKILSPNEADKDKNVSKLLKYEKAFKESNKHLLDLPSSKPSKGVPMRHVKYWMDNDLGLMFRMDNRVIQVNFTDKTKLIVFWEQKSLIFTQSLFENGMFMTFLSLKESKDSELKLKYSNTKKMVDAMNKGAW